MLTRIHFPAGSNRLAVILASLLLITSQAALSDEEASADEQAIGSSDEQVDEIVVTGSRLPLKPAELSRQVEIISREQIEASGMTKLDEYMQRLPQNVNAPTNVGSSVGLAQGKLFDFGNGPNAYAGSAFNLRGLGAQYTPNMT